MSTAKDPVRLLFDPACPEGQRAVLLQGMTIEPPIGAEERVWQALAGAIATAATTSTTAAATPGSGHAPGPAKAGVSAVKLVAIVVALATAATMVVTGLMFVGRTRDAQPSLGPPMGPTPPRQGDRVAAPVSAAAVPASEAEPAGPAPDRASHMPRGRHDAAPSAATRERETRLLDEARGAMQRGDAATALRRLDEHRRLFPTSEREEDRELLAIEALLVAKQDAAAAARAAAFLRRHPESTHLDEIRALGDRAAEARRR
jgi:hypothetical protein